MKFLITVCVLIALASAVTNEEFYAQLTAVAKTCSDDNDVIQLMLKAIAGEFTKDTRLYCPLQCVLKKIRFLKENGDLDEDFAIKNPTAGHTTAEVEAAIAKCKGSTGANECEKAYNIASCLYSELS